MATLKVELGSKPRKDGLHLVMIRITQNKKLLRVSTQRFIKKSEFNPNAEYGKWVRTTNPEHKVINEHIREMLSKYEAIQTNLLKDGSPLTLRSIKEKGSHQTNDEFKPYALLECERCLVRGVYRSAVKKRQVINKIEKFAGPNLRFADIDIAFLKKYTHDQLLKGKKANTIGTDHKSLRSIIRNAISDGIVRPENNPYLNFRITWQKTDRAKLNEEEIKAMEDLKLEDGSLLFHVRNMFMFSYYTAGTRFSDVLLLKWENIRNGRLFYKMAKTGDVQNIFITDRAQAILNYYKSLDSKPHDCVFPLVLSDELPSDYFGLTRVISAKNALANKYLKKLAEKAGVDKNVSFHISRHSFAYMAITKTGNLYAVSKSLRHKNLETTQVYLKESDNKEADMILKSVFN